MKIPAEFRDFEGNAFFYCKLCEKNLLVNDEEYIIEKAIKNYPEDLGSQVIFEHAVCKSCADKVSLELSKESREAVKTFFENKMSEEALEKRGFFNPLDFSKCLISGTDSSKTSEYQLYAYCKGENLQGLDKPPFCLSGEILEELQEQLSKETKDFLEDYMGTHFGVPPEWEGRPAPILF